jgi:hypothetical protein
VGKYLRRRNLDHSFRRLKLKLKVLSVYSMHVLFLKGTLFVIERDVGDCT